MTIYLATGNRHKYEEFRLLFPEHNLILPEEAGISFEFEETGNNYFENSFGKAQALWRQIQAPVLADDSGLSVDFLNGAPGIYSARYGSTAGHIPDSSRQTDMILKALKETDNRQASFVCCLTFLFGNYRFYSVQETLNGSIGYEKSGSRGFGYDPIFFPEGSDRSLACYTPEEKAAVSHRGKAAAALRRIIH